MSILIQDERHRVETVCLDSLESAFHDLQTPLTVIYCIADLLELPNLKPPELHTYASKLKSNVSCIKKIISGKESLLSFGGAIVSPIELVSYVRELTESMSSLADRKDMRLLFRSNCESKQAGLNQLALERIILNLVSNALKFSEREGCVEIMLTCLLDSVIIEVRDEGPGVPDAMIEAIFVRGVRLDGSKAGSGLGLSIVKTSTESLGGRVYAKNRTDRSGLSVIVELPVEK